MSDPITVCPCPSWARAENPSTHEPYCTLCGRDFDPSCCPRCGEADPYRCECDPEDLVLPLPARTYQLVTLLVENHDPVDQADPAEWDWQKVTGDRVVVVGHGPAQATPARALIEAPAVDPAQHLAGIAEAFPLTPSTDRSQA